MRKLLLLLVCLLCGSTGFSLKPQVTSQQARDAQWKSYSLPAINFTRQVTADKKLVFRVPADWKRDNTNNLLFHGPHGSTITLVTSKVPDGYPLMEYVAAFLKGIRDTGGLTETPLTRRTQFQDLEAREVFFEAPSPEGEMIRSTTWATVSGPMAVTFILRTPVEQAALVEPIFKTTVQSLLFVPGNYSEFESLRAEAIRTPLPGPIDEVENIVASLVELNSDREAIINRLTPLFLSLPDAAVDLLLDRRVAVRSAAAEALARSKNASLKSFLVHVVEDPDPFVAEPAARRLAQEANVVQLLLRPIMKGKTETIARLWPFLPKETRISLLHAFFSPTRAGKDHKVLMAALMLLETVPPADFKLPLARVLAINNDPLTMVALRVANARGEWFPADQLLKPAASTNESIKNLALESLGNSASIADIPKIEKALSKNTEELKLAIKKIQFRHELSLAKSAQELQEIIQKADASLADFAWPFNCEATIAGCSPATTKSSLPTDFKVKSFGENLFPQKVRHYTAIPNPAQAVQRFYQTLHGLQLDSPRAQSNLILVMAGIRQTLGEQLGAPPDAAALIDYTGIKPDSPFVLGSWTAPGARDTTSAAHRKAIVLRVKDRERFERSLERLQQNTGNFMALTDFVAVGARGIAAFPAILPISAQAVLAGDPNKSKTTPQLKHSFISHTEWNGIPIKSIEYRSVDPDGNINGATTHLAFVDDVAILTSDVPTLRELLTNAAASEQQLLAGNEEFRRAKDSDGDVVYFSDLKAILADPADTSMESTKKANESGALKFANSSWENSHRMVFDESEWSKPLLPFKPQDLSAPRELLPASTIAYYLMKLDVADALETWPKTMNLSDGFEAEQSLFALDFKKEVAPELGPECGAVLLQLPEMRTLEGGVWATFCKLKSNKLTEALTTGKLLRGVGPTSTFAEVKSADTSYFLTIKNGFLVISNSGKGLAAFDDKKTLAETRDYSRAAAKAPAGIVAFGGYNLEAAMKAASATTADGLQAQIATIIFSVASAFHSQSFFATASPGGIEGRSLVAMDREGRYAVADFSYLPRGTNNITYATLEPHGAPIIDQKRISNLVLKVRAKAPGPIDGIRDDIKTPTQTVEQKSPNELIVTIAARRSASDKKIQLPVTDPALSAFLKSTPEFAANDAVVSEQAKQIAGDDRDAWSVARKLADWTHSNLEWKSVARAGAAETLATREADCSEFSQLFVAMARSLGLPARIVSGLAYSGNSFGGHAWVEVWVGEWVELDPTWGTDFVDATHIRNNESTLVTAAALNLIDLEVLETRHSISEFQKSAKALADHLVKTLPAGNKSDLEASMDLATLTDEFMGKGAWNSLNEQERDRVSSAYRRTLHEILAGYGKPDSSGELRLLHLEEKGDRADVLCMWTDDTLLKLQLVQRDDVWRVVEIVQVDTDLRIAAGTLGPTIQSIQDNRAGKKTTPAPFSEFIQALTLMNSDPAKGVEAANRILQTKPGDRSVRLLKAYGLFALDKVDEGIKLLTELSDEQPAYPAALYRLASMLSETEPAKSIELYKRYSLLEPNDPRSYRELAVLYEDSNQPALAEAAYRKTIAADPRTRWNYVNLIGFLLSNDRFGEVEAVLTAADKQLAADNDLLAATIYELQDEIKLVDAQRLAANHPEKMKTSAWANVSLAKIYMRDGQHLPALEWLNRAAQIDTEYAAPHFLMSEAYLKLSRVNEAVKAAEEAVLVEPENASGHYRRACALAQLGRRRDAMLALEKAVELDPDYLSEISDDPELKTLKSLPAFKKLVQGQQDPK